MRNITSIKTYIDTIMQLRSDPSCEEYPNYQWFFRGQKDSTWSVEPSIFRNDGVAKEYELIQSALRQNPFDFRDSKTDFEILTKLQHYGLGTRLLDVTLNPLVALYFACEEQTEYTENRNGQYTKSERDGIVFVKFAPWHAPDEMATRIAAAIPFFKIEEGYSIQSLLNDLIGCRIISGNESEMLRNDNFHLLTEYIQNSYFVLSSHSNERLIRQSGGFVLPTSLVIKPCDLKVTETSSVEKAHQHMNGLFDSEVLIIPSKNKAAIREELDFFNINEATLFPELEHQMMYIKQKNVPIRGIVPDFQKLIALAKNAPKEFNDLTPDLSKIVMGQFPDLSHELQNKILDEVAPLLLLVDWKQKESIRSQIRSTVKRLLQQELSAAESNHQAEKLLKMLLAPAEEFAEIEVNN